MKSRADPRELASAARMIQSSSRPLIIAGGGVQYGNAVEELTNFAELHQIPVAKTIAGRANLLWDHSLNAGPIGVTGSDSANAMAAEADVVICVGRGSKISLRALGVVFQKARNLYPSIRDDLMPTNIWLPLLSEAPNRVYLH